MYGGPHSSLELDRGPPDVLGEAGAFDDVAAPATVPAAPMAPLPPRGLSAAPPQRFFAQQPRLTSRNNRLPATLLVSAPVGRKEEELFVLYL